MGRKHYHVISGLRGYMPGINYVFLTLKEARGALRDEVRDVREIGYKCKKTGKDYWECYRRKPKDRWMEIPYVIYISECDMDECLEEMEEDVGYNVSSAICNSSGLETPLPYLRVFDKRRRLVAEGYIQDIVKKMGRKLKLKKGEVYTYNDIIDRLLAKGYSIQRLRAPLNILLRERKWRPRPELLRKKIARW